MTTYSIKRNADGRAQSLSDLMDGLAPLPAPAVDGALHQRVAGNQRGPVRSALRLQLEAMRVNDEITVVGRTPSQIHAVFAHARKTVGRAEYKLADKGTYTLITRTA